MDEVDWLLNEEQSNFMANQVNHEPKHRADARRKLEDYFERKRLKRELGYEYFDD
jgi:hypothetical protein